MSEKEAGNQDLGRLASVVVRNRYDPERLAALKRSLTGTTRCPVCDSLNPAEHKFCEKCGAYLYPEMRHEDEEKELTQGRNQG